MGGRKLLDAGVFTEQQEIARPNVPNFVFPWSWSYMYLELKSIHC